MVFMRAIQRAIKEGRFKLKDKGVAKMTNDTDLFPKLDVNIVSFSGYHSP